MLAIKEIANNVIHTCKEILQHESTSYYHSWCKTVISAVYYINGDMQNARIYYKLAGSDVRDVFFTNILRYDWDEVVADMESDEADIP